MSHDAIDFCRSLRAEGLAVPVDATVAFVDALSVVDLARFDQVYWAGRATLVRRPEDVAVYDDVFERTFLGAESVAPMVVERQVEVGIDGEPPGDLDDPDDNEEQSAERDRDRRHVRFSAVELLSDRDFATCTADELDELARAIDRLGDHGTMRPSTRLIAADAATRHLDLGRTLNAALRTDGEIVDRHHRRRSAAPRRLVLLLDISGSMQSYARPLMRFAHAAVLARSRVEVFALGTRLTRLTRELATRDPDVALHRAGDAVVDWSGGTRLGEGLRAFVDEWGQRGVARGAVTVIVSDGWDRGDPARLEEQMSRLSRLAHRIVWVNPLRASPGYEPLARGMVAALPYCDEFVDGHSLTSLVSLAALLRGDSRSPVTNAGALQ